MQALLKTKVARWKAHFLLRICEKITVQHSSEWMTYYSRYATRKKGVAQLGPGPKALASPNLDERKSFLVCFKSLVT
jgi:hypothetical protein